ncbi:MAG: hypothetical protein QG671_1751 [Actinomycetota bacterium]|nr:hypothetical protein [Actinomycetota bacterium]
MSRVMATLNRLGCTGIPHELPESARTAVQAAETLGVSVSSIASSIVFATHGTAGDEPLLVITSGAHRVDTRRVASMLGSGDLDRVDAAFIRQWSGFAIGGVAPVGWTGLHPSVPDAMPYQPTTLVDISLAHHRRIWAAAGHPRYVFETSYAELLRITGGNPAEID